MQVLGPAAAVAAPVAGVGVAVGAGLEVERPGAIWEAKQVLEEHKAEVGGTAMQGVFVALSISCNLCNGFACLLLPALHPGATGEHITQLCTAGGCAPGDVSDCSAPPCAAAAAVGSDRWWSATAVQPGLMAPAAQVAMKHGTGGH